MWRTWYLTPPDHAGIVTTLLAAILVVASGFRANLFLGKEASNNASAYILHHDHVAFLLRTRLTQSAPLRLLRYHCSGSSQSLHRTCQVPWYVFPSCLPSTLAHTGE